MHQQLPPITQTQAFAFTLAYGVIGIVAGYIVFLATDMIVYRITAVFLIIIILSNAYARLFVRSL